MDGLDDIAALKALLDWQAELGADVPISDAPVDRYAASAEAAAAATAPRAAPAASAQGAPAATPPARAEPVAEAEAAAAAAPDLEALRAAIDVYPHCDLKRGARTLVFADGQPGARVMIVGEAPGREEDQKGLPFVGRAGQLLDRMLAAIDLSRTAPDPGHAVYITNMLPWRPPENRTPTTEELAMFAPFVRRHIALAAPEVLIVMGNTACAGLMDRKGITKLRGQWAEVAGLPAIPMFHPAYLLRNPAAKREAWADLLSLKVHLRAGAA